MILGLDKRGALYLFSSPMDAERELEAIDVQQDEFEFCDAMGRRYAVVYTIPPEESRLGPLRIVEIGAFRLIAQDGIEPGLIDRFIEAASHIGHSSVPGITSTKALRDSLRRAT